MAHKVDFPSSGLHSQQGNDPALVQDRKERKKDAETSAWAFQSRERTRRPTQSCRNIPTSRPLKPVGPTSFRISARPAGIFRKPWPISLYMLPASMPARLTCATLHNAKFSNCEYYNTVVPGPRRWTARRGQSHSRPTPITAPMTYLP